jgi:hypothetical protein
MNRKSDTNSKGKSSSPLTDALVSIEPDEYARLYKNSLLNNANFTRAVYDDMQEEISKSVGRPIHFAPYGEKTHRDAFDNETSNLDLCLFYQECSAQRDDGKKIDVVFHKIVRTSPDYKSLFRCLKFTQITQPFIRPVHFQLDTGKHLTTTIAMAMGSNATPTTILQNKLIASHGHANSLSLAAFVEPLEVLLDVVLMKAIFYRDAVFLFFEWSDTMPFTFIMSFMTHFDSKPSIAKETRRLPNRHATAYVLSRRDVVLEPGSVRAIEEVQEEGGEAIMDEEDGTIVVDGEDERKVTFVVSECADGNAIIDALKKSVESVFISYITSGYIKRE